MFFNTNTCSVQPSLLQKILARNQVWAIAFFGIAVTVALAFAIQGQNWKQMLFMLLPGGTSGALLSWIVLKALYHLRVRVNGGPFRRGDLVQIIGGAYAGKAASIYEEWPSRGQVRVDLSDSGVNDSKDVSCRYNC
jgi:hypothetical protein